MTKFVATYIRYTLEVVGEVKYIKHELLSKNCEKMENSESKNSEILNTQGRAILLDVFGRRPPTRLSKSRFAMGSTSGYWQ